MTAGGWLAGWVGHSSVTWLGAGGAVTAVHHSLCSVGQQGEEQATRSTMYYLLHVGVTTATLNYEPYA